MKGKLFIPIFIVVVFAVGAALYVYNPSPTEYGNGEGEEQVFCTTEAKLCPDGSYVGRVPPSCEFAECPSTSTPIFEDGTLIE